MGFFLFILMALFAEIQWTAALNNELENCGQLNETQVYSEFPASALDEFPWFARVYYTNIETGETHLFRCVAVLITSHHLLAPAHCLVNIRSYRPVSVLLGDSNYGNDDNQPDCDSLGACAPPPKVYSIADIAIHPNFDLRDRLNDIAVIQLDQEVELSPYIQPICLPPASDYSADYLAQYLTYAGFVRSAPNGLQNNKLKIVAHVKLRERCAALVQRTISDTYLCASSSGEYLFLTGSALMGVNIDNSELKHYYLIGILCFGPPRRATNIELYTKISAHINWINSNIKTPRGKNI